MSSSAVPTATTPQWSGRLADALGDLSAAVTEAIDAARHLSDLPAEHLLAAVTELASVRRRADAAHLALADALALRSRTDLDALGATSAADLLGRHTALPPAVAKKQLSLAKSVRAGRTADDGGAHTAPALPALGAAHAAGRISTEVLDLAARTLRSLPLGLLRTMLSGLDASLAEDLPARSWAEAVALCQELVALLDPDRGFTPEDYQKRRLSLVVADDGWVRVSGLLDPVTGAQLRAAVQHYAKPDPAVKVPEIDPVTGLPTGRTVEVADPRTADQRNADAIGLIARQGVSNSERGGGEPPRVIVSTTAEQLAALATADGTGAGAGRASCDQTGRLPQAALRSLLSRSVLQAVVFSADGAQSSPLALGRGTRCFSAGQRRAMFARDGGCIIPGCDAPMVWLEGHHVLSWADGHPTDVGNGVLGCPHHHVQIGLGVWEVDIVDGVPRVRPPSTVDPLRRWLTNPRPATAARARALAGMDPPWDDAVPDLPRLAS